MRRTCTLISGLEGLNTEFLGYLSLHFAACPNILKYNFLQGLDCQPVVVFPREDKIELKITDHGIIFPPRPYKRCTNIGKH